MSLTDDYLQGTLDEGFYYFKMPNGNIATGGNLALQRYKLTKDGDKIKVLDPVPSYKELQTIKGYEALYHRAVGEMYKYKGLLKECKEHMYFQKEIDNETITLLTRINDALGENEE